MTTYFDEDKVVHEGRNVKRFREMLRIKQDVFVDALGEGWTQKKVSVLETKEKIEEPILEKIAGILKMPVEAIKSFDEGSTVNFINNIHDNKFDNSNAIGVAYQRVVNPVERWLETLEENKKLYERLLESEKEKVALLEKLINKK